jgi:hypothetical protein
MLTGKFKIQKLELRPRADAEAARRGKVGRVWTNVAMPKRGRAVAERQAIRARIDHPDSIVRVRQ